MASTKTQISPLAKKYYGVDHPWPLIEFEYPAEKPKSYQRLNVPQGICDEYQKRKEVMWFSHPQFRGAPAQPSYSPKLKNVDKIRAYIPNRS
jgi:hypothetical protein